MGFQGDGKFGAQKNILVKGTPAARLLPLTSAFRLPTSDFP